MTNIWNERYSSEEYIYGTEPNVFFSEKLIQLKPGKILLPAEGEGRNAVFAAKKGWQVTAFDNSIEGQKKALQLAEKESVSISYQIDSYDSANFPNEYFDCIALIYTHMPPGKRTVYHQKLASFLKSGGYLILEGFSKNQLQYNSGGPKEYEMLFSVEELKSDFSDCNIIQIEETETELKEGTYHDGKASVIRLFASR
jgi:cyclopropane fatty-acyl-phospholipid synthase-like methyltransferase